MKVEKRKSNNERRIVTAMIVDRHVLSRIANRWDNELFNNRWSNLIGSWCVDFLKQYDKAPKGAIETLFETWSEKSRDEATVSLVSDFLSSLSNEYEALSKEINAEYILDLAGRHFNKVRLERTVEDIQNDLNDNQLEQAERKVVDWGRIELGNAEDVNVLGDMEAIREAFETEAEPLITFPGALGQFFGTSLERDGFIAFMAPDKRGKCIDGDAKVLFANGKQYQIADVVKKKIKGKLLTLNEQTQRFERTTIQDYHDNGIKDCWKLTTRTGRSVTTTGNHLYLTPYGWKNLLDIKIGDHIAVPKRIMLWSRKRVPIAPYIRYQINKGKSITRRSFISAKGSKAYNKYIKSDILWDKVASIEFVGQKHTYDLTIPNHHNFIADDCIVHNSFWLSEIAHRAILNRKRVAFFEAGDMSRNQILRRIMTRISRHPEYAGKVDYPTKIEHTRGEMIAEVETEQRKFDSNLSWQYAWEQVERFIKRKLRTRKPLWRLSVHPNSTISVVGIRSILSNWEREEWVPDIVIIDYADILAPIDSKLDERGRINDTWKAMRAMSQSLHCLVVTASQTDSSAYKQNIITRSNFSDDKRKLAHVTGMIGINQTLEEKETNLMRLNWVVRRSARFSEMRCVHVASCLELGNPAVRSCW